MQFFQDHFPTIIGLPVGAAVAFGVVTLIRQSEGNIKVKLGRFELTRAGGAIFLWVVCYLAIAYSIWLLWGC